MSNISVNFNNVSVSDENIQKFNDTFDVTSDEYGVVFWADFEGAKLVKSDDGLDVTIDLPTLSGEFLERDKFVNEFAKAIDSGSARIQFAGTTVNNYVIIASDSDVKVKKFEDRPVQIGETLVISKNTPPTPVTYNTTIVSGATAVNNVSLDGSGTLEFNNLNSSDDPVTALKTANILVGGTPVAQVTFTTSYIGKIARYIKDNTNYTIVFADTSITATIEA